MFTYRLIIALLVKLCFLLIGDCCKNRIFNRDFHNLNY